MVEIVLKQIATIRTNKSDGSSVFDSFPVQVVLL